MMHDAERQDQRVLDWIGGIPNRWGVHSLGSQLAANKSSNKGLVESRVLSLSYGRVIVKPLDKLRGLVPESFETYQIVEPGDIVIRPTDLQNDQTSLRVGQSMHRGIITSAYICLRPTDSLNHRYASYLLAAYDFMKVFYGFGSGLRQNLDVKHIKHIPVPVPPLEEQGLIVRYFDHAELRIAKAIAAKQGVLSLLQEHKLAKFETVVFGVADGQYSVAASSHPWMGDIPKHWKVVRAKSILKLLSRPVDLSSETVTCFRDGTVTKRSNRGKIGFTESIYFSGYQGVEPGDLVVHQMDAFAGAIGVSDSAGKCTPVYAICKVDASARPEFIAILLKLMARRGWVTALSRGIRVRSTDFRFPVLANQYLPLPPVEEQDAMLDLLAKATADIASAITAVSTEIALLKEYRTRLISDVVTGKMDVRGEAAKLPEIDPMELETVAVGENGDDEETTNDD